MSKIYVQIRSGLGNQLFQFAFGFALAEEFKKELILCPSHYDSYGKYWIKKLVGREVRSFRLPLILKTKYPVVETNLINKLLEGSAANVLKENEVETEEILRQSSEQSTLYLVGYWQSPNLFARFQKELVELIQPSFRLSKECSEMLKSIDQNSIGIHVRRGDFLTNRSFGACSIDYYVHALKKISNQVRNPNVVVFTNDKMWVKKNFPKDIAYSIYSNTSINSDIEEMYLMTKFPSLIISNSTFSWWGAYLNLVKERFIVCPCTWFLKMELQRNAHHFICNGWNAIDNTLELDT